MVDGYTVDGYTLLLSRDNSEVVGSSLELALRHSRTHCTITLVLSNNRMSKTKNSLFSRLNLFKRTLDSNAAPGGHLGIRSLLSQSMLKPGFNMDVCDPTEAGAILMSLARVTTEGHMDFLDLSQYLRPC